MKFRLTDSSKVRCPFMNGAICLGSSCGVIRSDGDQAFCGAGGVVAAPTIAPRVEKNVQPAPTPRMTRR